MPAPKGSTRTPLGPRFRFEVSGQYWVKTSNLLSIDYALTYGWNIKYYLHSYIDRYVYGYQQIYNSVNVLFLLLLFIFVENQTI